MIKVKPQRQIYEIKLQFEQLNTPEISVLAISVTDLVGVLTVSVAIDWVVNKKKVRCYVSISHSSSEGASVYVYGDVLDGAGAVSPSEFILKSRVDEKWLRDFSVITFFKRLVEIKAVKNVVNR